MKCGMEKRDGNAKEMGSIQIECLRAEELVGQEEIGGLSGARSSAHSDTRRGHTDR